MLASEQGSHQLNKSAKRRLQRRVNLREQKQLKLFSSQLVTAVVVVVVGTAIAVVAVAKP